MQAIRFVLVLALVVTHVCAFRGKMPMGSQKGAMRHLRMAELSAPPKSFLDCVKQAATGCEKAIADGNVLLEVDFPPLPLEFLEDSSSSAYDIANANTRWAIDFAQKFSSMKRVTILYPDQPELEAALAYVDEPGGVNPYPNITLATPRSDSIKNAQSIDQVLLSIFGATVGGTVEAVPNTDLYICLVSSCQELPDLEKLHSLDPTVPLVLFNLKLDILRGDLGLPLFPKRDLHHRFLSRVRPAYVMRSRSFATSLRKPPFIVNYSGLLFRRYPEPYQAVLNTGEGNSRTVSTMPERPTNKDFRAALTGALVVPGVTKEELSGNMGNLVWWEKETEKDESDAWRF